MPGPGSVLDATAHDAEDDRLKEGKARKNDIKVPHHKAAVRKGRRPDHHKYVLDMVAVGGWRIERLGLRVYQEHMLGMLLNPLLQDHAALVDQRRALERLYKLYCPLTVVQNRLSPLLPLDVVAAGLFILVQIESSFLRIKVLEELLDADVG